jgi:hypothetical protein
VYTNNAVDAVSVRALGNRIGIRKAHPASGVPPKPKGDPSLSAPPGLEHQTCLTLSGRLGGVELWLFRPARSSLIGKAYGHHRIRSHIANLCTTGVRFVNCFTHRRHTSPPDPARFCRESQQHVRFQCLSPPPCSVYFPRSECILAFHHLYTGKLVSRTDFTFHPLSR